MCFASLYAPMMMLVKWSSWSWWSCSWSCSWSWGGSHGDGCDDDAGGCDDEDGGGGGGGGD